TWKTRPLRQGHAANGARASNPQTTAILIRRGVGLGRAALRRPRNNAGARAIAANAPSGRSKAAKVTAKVKLRADPHAGPSWKRAADQSASARTKTVGPS